MRKQNKTKTAKTALKEHILCVDGWFSGWCGRVVHWNVGCPMSSKELKGWGGRVFCGNRKNKKARAKILHMPQWRHKLARSPFTVWIFLFVIFAVCGDDCVAAEQHISFVSKVCCVLHSVRAQGQANTRLRLLWDVFLDGQLSDFWGGFFLLRCTRPTYCFLSSFTS